MLPGWLAISRGWTAQVEPDPWSVRISVSAEENEQDHRPLRYEHSYDTIAYDIGQKNHQVSFTVDLIVHW
jgi:hypothetical protein